MLYFTVCTVYFYVQQCLRYCSSQLEIYINLKPKFMSENKIFRIPN